MEIVEDETTRKIVLEIEVRGKQGVGFCKDMPSTVRPNERFCDRPKPTKAESRRERQRSRCEGKEEALPTADPPEFPEAMDNVFPGNHVKLFNGILTRAKPTARRPAASVVRAFDNA